MTDTKPRPPTDAPGLAIARALATDYRYPTRRKNNPPAGLAAQGRIEERPSERYAYDPHLPPVLRFDQTGDSDKLPDLLETAKRRPLTDDEARLLAAALRHREPWLEWTGKRERKTFEVDPVALHIHERVAAKAILAVAARQEVQRSLFADPQQTYHEAVQFYRHDVAWANRLILGDSLQVMASLAKREGLAGQVQMIYLDPPYGIKFASNFQPRIGQRDVKDRPEDLTRESEMVKAYRDTWSLGVHSYLSYLRDRLALVRELLCTSGSVFVQIGVENVDLVRLVMDEVFGEENFLSLITFVTTSGFESNKLARGGNYLLWYARDAAAGVKFRAVYAPQEREVGEDGYRWVMLPGGVSRPLTSSEQKRQVPLFEGAKLYRPDNIVSQGAASVDQVFRFHGREFRPGLNSHWKAGYPAGMDRLSKAARIHESKNSIRYIRLEDDFQLREINDRLCPYSSGDWVAG